MKANAKTYREHQIASAPSIEHELDADDMEFLGGKTWIQPTFTVRYAITKYRDFGSDKYDVDILDVSLSSAKGWFGDYQVPVPCGDVDFCRTAEATFEEWHKLECHRLLIERKCIADYQRNES